MLKGWMVHRIVLEEVRIEWLSYNLSESRATANQSVPKMKRQQQTKKRKKSEIFLLEYYSLMVVS
jgi:hypothetical protein